MRLHSKTKNLLGRVYGTYLVTEFNGYHAISESKFAPAAYWLCECQVCGQLRSISYLDLDRYNQVQHGVCSCGTVLRTRSNRTQIESKYQVYRHNAATRNLGFYLSLEDAAKFFNSPCHYCGFLDENKLNGIDRVNNQDDYTNDNCVSCCTTCNMAKRNLSKNDFLSWAKRLIEYQNR